jgi:hypothetical protein
MKNLKQETKANSLFKIFDRIICMLLKRKVQKKTTKERYNDKNDTKFKVVVIPL